MSAGRYNFVVTQGGTVSRVFTYRDATGALVNLTAYTAHMKVRLGLWEAGAEKPAGDAAVALDASAMIVLGGALGTITLTIPSASMTMAAGNYVYDLDVQSGAGVVTVLLEGSFTVYPRISRA